MTNLRIEHNETINEFTLEWVEENRSIVAHYYSLNELIEALHNEEMFRGAVLTKGREYVIGAQLGAIAVEIAETSLDERKITCGLENSTDSAWAEALEKIRNLIAFVLVDMGS